MNKEEYFNKIAAENGQRIRRICSYYSYCAEDSKDIYQEVLVNIWRSLDSFRGDAALSTWIYRIAVNTSLSFNRKSIKDTKWQVELNEENLATLNEEENNDISDISLGNLQIALNACSVIDKSIISLLLEGLPLREIADIIGLTEPNVRVKIHRIKKALRTQLNGLSDE